MHLMKIFTYKKALNSSVVAFCVKDISAEQEAWLCTRHTFLYLDEQLWLKNWQKMNENAIVNSKNWVFTKNIRACKIHA